MSTESAASFPAETEAVSRGSEHGPYSRSLGHAALVVLALLWGYTVYRLGTLWYSSQDYSYGWFVPLLCLGLFWERWQRRPTPEPMAITNGPLIVFGGLLLCLGLGCLLLEVIPYWRLAGWIFALCVLGLTFCILLMLGGRPWVNHFAFPLLFFLIAVPWPSRIEVPLIDKLSHLNAAISTVVSNFLGTPAIRRGVLIETGSGLVGVDEACSGIRSFQATVMIALFLGELFRYSFFRRIFFLLCGAGLAFTCNVVRTTYLVRTCDLKGKDAVNLYHDPAGFAMMGVTLGGLLLLALIFRSKGKRSERGGKDSPGAAAKTAGAEASTETPPAQPRRETEVIEETSEEPEEGGRRRRRGRRAATLRLMLAGLVAWVVLVEVGIEAWFRSSEKQAKTAPQWTLLLPTQEPQFQEVPIRDAMRSMLKYDEGRQAQWKEGDSRPWQMYYLRWMPTTSRYRAMETASQARGHNPDLCLKNAGMVLQNDLGSKIVQINGATLRTRVQRFLDQGRTMHIITVYWENDPRSLPLVDLSENPGTSTALRQAAGTFGIHDRLRNEKRVLKLGVWGMESDEAANEAFKRMLEKMVGAGKTLKY